MYTSLQPIVLERANRIMEVLVCRFHPRALILLLTHIALYSYCQSSCLILHSSFSCLFLSFSVFLPLLTPITQPLALLQCCPSTAICSHFLLLPRNEHTHSDTHTDRHTTHLPDVLGEKSLTACLQFSATACSMCVIMFVARR